jgi:hypothetical protein
MAAPYPCPLPMSTAELPLPLTTSQILRSPIRKPHRWPPCRRSALTCHWLARERNWVQTHGSVSRHVVDCVRSHFSWEQWSCSTLLMITWKIAMRWSREIHMAWDHTRTEHGMCVACWSGFPCRVYIDSNHRDSQIWVPLVHDSLHVVN